MSESRKKKRVAKKRKPQNPLSVVQRKMLFRISFVIIVLLLLWIVFAPGRGLFHLRQQKKHLAELIAGQAVLIQQNKTINEDIERLHNDKKYLEEIARETHGMLKDNEMVFDFARKDEKRKK